ncbi:MAG TPA: hypothetical protein VJW51_00005, partial [Candidatus Acidoferrales bacterium]|nr:hypothetical protein [Candidatus Acidoferrales bacterium]
MSEFTDRRSREAATSAAELRDSALFAALADDLLAQGLSIRFRAGGESMRPAIGDGENIEVSPAETEGLRPGDILLTQGDDGFKAHRLVGEGGESSNFQTRGDASRGVDSRSRGRIVGRVVSVERNGRRIGLVGKARVALQAANRLAFCVRAALAARAKRLGIGGAAVLVLVLAALLVAPAARAQDLSVTETVAPSVVAAGGTITYTITFKNTGATAAATTELFMITPANTTFASITRPGGWGGAAPAVGAAGNITGTIASFPGNTTVTFTIAVTVNAGVAAGTQILQNVNGTSNTTDPNGQNNSASASTLVEPAADADMALSMVANPATVFVSANYTYNITVTDLGQANAANVTVTDTLPAGVTLVSATPSQGGPCTGTAPISCPLGTVNFNATATVAITVTAPATAAMISNTASVSTTSTDPVAGNNSATVIVVVQPIVCAKPAKDGAGGTLAGIVNTYYPPAGAEVAAAGTTSVSLGTATGSATPTPIGIGDLLLIIQMQDAAINSTNTGAYGDASAGDPGSGSTALNSSGLYEFVTATNAVPLAGPNTLNFVGTGANGGLLNTYTSAAYVAGSMGQRTFQVIRVPQYQSALLGGTLAALAWNGTVGGVLALDVAGQLSLNSVAVAVDATGFRGGAGIKLTGPGTGGSANTDYRTLSSNPINASKGEGIAGTPQFLANAAITLLINTGVEGYPNGSYARGAPGNAGGGGTDGDSAANTENSGGGGGGNGGTGGIGGYGWNLPGVGQGFGGVAYPATISGVAMGGGGGSGTTNDGTADPTNANPAGINSSGAAGGGILLIRAGSVVGTGSVSANGQTALNTMQDAGGGGGAGGSIIFLAVSGPLGTTLAATANGGTGGSTWRTMAPGGYPGQRHGPGGGGGGGAIFLSGTAVTSVAGGNSGVTDTDGDSFGSLAGSAGFFQTTLVPSQTPGVRSGGECAQADLQ